MKNFFEREHDKFYESTYLPKIKNKLNAYNLALLTKNQILNLLKYGEETNFLAYRFEVLKEWIKNNERYTKGYIEDLDQVITKLYLDSELNSFEKQYILDVNAITFAKIRNLKQLIVDFSINPKELVFYRYEIDRFNEIKNNNESTVLNNCDFYITTQRIIVSKQIDIISITYDQIKSFKFRRDKIVFNLGNNKQYCVRCSNTYVIYASLERVLKREKIVFNS